MEFHIIRVGKPDDICARLAQRYLTRMAGWSRLLTREFKNDQQQLVYLKKVSLEPDFRLVSLDERGRLWSSTELAAFVEKQIDNPGIRRLGFVVGSPYGLSEEVKSLCDLSWSLSPAVFPSDLVWVLVHEQLYRAFSILRGLPYHHG